jgi:copper(I)-binding protein
VTDIVWSGSLEDGHYDEFVFQAYFTDAYQPGATVHFPVVQECEKLTEEWTEVPAAGQDAHSLASPAPGVRIVAAANAAPAAQKAGAITVEQPWSRATPGGAKVGGGYVRITNTGSAPDRLVGGSFPLASRVEVHEMRLEGDVMRMKPVEGGLEIKPGATVELKPGGFHLMFMDLKEPLKEGQTIKGTLVFEKAGPIDVDYTVRSMGGGAPAEHKH